MSLSTVCPVADEHCNSDVLVSFQNLLPIEGTEISFNFYLLQIKVGIGFLSGSHL